MVFYQADDGTTDAAWLQRIPRAHRNACAGIWIRCATWSARNGQDGFVAEDVVRGMATDFEIERLVEDAQIWQRVEGREGWQMVGEVKWEPDNRTAAEVAAYRATDAERKRVARARSGGTSKRTSTGTSGGDSGRESVRLGHEESSTNAPGTSPRTSGRTPPPYLGPRDGNGKPLAPLFAPDPAAVKAGISLAREALAAAGGART